MGPAHPKTGQAIWKCLKLGHHVFKRVVFQVGAEQGHLLQCQYCSLLADKIRNPQPFESGILENVSSSPWKTDVLTIVHLAKLGVPGFPLVGGGGGLPPH